MLYFDNQTVAPISKEVISTMVPYFSGPFVSLLSHHSLSKRGRAPFEEALQTLYLFAGAEKEDHFILTSSGAEAVNQVIFSTYLEYARKIGKNHFLTTNLEEAPVIMAMSRLEEMASHFEMVAANEKGIVTKEAVEEMITPRTCLLSLSWANGLTGVIQPIEQISEVCRRRGVLLHVDATHILGKGGYSFSKSGADFMTFNGDPLLGPKGVGALFIKKNVEISPLIVGDKEQQSLRAGSINLPLLIGFAKAAKLMQENQDHYGIEIATLRSYFEEQLKEVSVNPFYMASRIPNVSTLLFPKIASDALGFYLDQNELYATFGGNHFQKLSHILQACHIDKSLIHSGMSFALSHEHTRSDIDKAVKIILHCVKQLKRLGV